MTTDVQKKKVLSNLMSNVSDHHPIKMSVKFELKPKSEKLSNTLNTNTRIKWDKVDADQYKAMVGKALSDVSDLPTDTSCNIGDILLQTCKTLKTAAEECSSNRKRYSAKSKLKVWSPRIKIALTEMRHQYNIWTKNGKPVNPTNQIYINRIETRKEFRRQVRIEQAKRKNTEKEQIIETRTKDMKLFHQLVKNNRIKGGNLIMDLNVGNNCYSGEENILEGFQHHFQKLASAEETCTQNDPTYHQNVEYEIQLINNLVHGKSIQPATVQELQNATKSLNKGKSADIYDITIEHITQAGDSLEPPLLKMINIIFHHGNAPDILKVGLLTPVFKNKGDKNCAINYRGITVLPVINKIIEAILKQRINPAVVATQNRAQRGFTEGASPMNSALPVEEIYRESKDINTEYELVLLDAKSAFGVVIHNHLMWRVFHIGIQDNHWSLINSMHQNATSAIKWDGKISEQFPVTQGGILSADLYKLYINPLLERLENSHIGSIIGNVLCNASACADDVALMSRTESDMQIQINMAQDFAGMEGYTLQPKKSVSIYIRPVKTRALDKIPFMLGTKEIQW